MNPNLPHSYRDLPVWLSRRLVSPNERPYLDWRWSYSLAVLVCLAFRRDAGKLTGAFFTSTQRFDERKSVFCRRTFAPLSEKWFHV